MAKPTPTRIPPDVNPSGDQEEWRPIPSLPGYSASSEGRILGPRGLIGGTPDRDGYRRANISGRRKCRFHRVVCEAFHGSAPTSEAHAAHLDGDPANNRADNLAWKTARANNEDKRAHGTHQTGEKHPRVKLTAAQVAEIREGGQSSRAAARKYGVSQSQVSRIRLGQQWSECAQTPPENPE